MCGPSITMSANVLSPYFIASATNPYAAAVIDPPCAISDAATTTASSTLPANEDPRFPYLLWWEKVKLLRLYC